MNLPRKSVVTHCFLCLHHIWRYNTGKCSFCFVCLKWQNPFFFNKRYNILFEQIITTDYFLVSINGVVKIYSHWCQWKSYFKNVLNFPDECTFLLVCMYVIRKYKSTLNYILYSLLWLNHQNICKFVCKSHATCKAKDFLL